MKYYVAKVLIYVEPVHIRYRSLFGTIAVSANFESSK